jgi:hypothetical protein
MPGTRTLRPEVARLFSRLVATAVEWTRSARVLKTDEDTANIASVHDLPEFTHLRQEILADSDLAGAVLGNLSWCTDDEVDWAIDTRMSHYIRFAARRQLDATAESGDRASVDSCRAVVQYLNTDVYTWNFLAPLDNLVLEFCDRVRLSEEVWIRSLTSDERKGVSESPFRRVGVGLEARALAARGHRLAPAAARAPVEAALIALRLLKHKGVWAQSIGVLSDDPLEHDGADRLTWRPFEWTTDRRDPTFTDPSEGYVLSKDEADAVRTLWRIVLDRLAGKGALTRALRKFDAAYNQTRAEQVLLEIWGALKALTVPAGSRRISDTAAAALAEMLANDASERTELRRRIKNSYRLRSRLVHGDDAGGQDLLRTCSETVEWFRKATLIRLDS